MAWLNITAMGVMRTDERRLIDQMLPLRTISVGGAGEKSKTTGRIGNIHRWWATKPTTVSRAIAYAALVGLPMSEHQDIIRDMCNYTETTDPKKPFIRDHIRARIRDIWGDPPPKVLDPFGGSGVLPFAAAWLGCESHSMDYNPVAVLIQKCVLEYPARYGRKLYDDVKEISKKIKDHIRYGVAEFYPAEYTARTGDIKPGYNHYAYRWCRTVPCTCGAAIPLVQAYLLSGKKTKIHLYPVIHNDRSVTFGIAGGRYGQGPKPFEKPPPAQIKHKVAKCPVCGYTYTSPEIRQMINDGMGGEQMMISVYTHPDMPGRHYFEINRKHDDDKLYEKCKGELEKRRTAFRTKYGIDPIPTNIIPTPESREYHSGGPYWITSRVVMYGYTRWAHLFNDRQLLCLITILDILRQTEEQLTAEYGQEYGAVIMAYLALIFDKTIEKYCKLSRWHAPNEFVLGCFAQQAIIPIWDYVEVEPTSIWHHSTKSALEGLNAALSAADKGKYHVQMASATDLPYDDDYFDAVITDPPYYNSVQYSKTADFFYVWLKKTVGHLSPYQDMFRGILTPKKDEVVQTSTDVIGHTGTSSIIRDKDGYQQLMTKSLKEMYRVLKRDGILILVYAHKTTAGWETLIQSMLDSGFVITAAWPIDSEHKTRMGAQNTASLASSIYMVAHKRKKEPRRYYRDVKPELRDYVVSKLDYFMKEGVSGADFYISAIGASCAIYGKYENVLHDDTGKPVTVREMLDDIRGLCSDHIVNMLITGDAGTASIDAMSKAYISWRWAYGDQSVEYDEARKMFTGVGLDIGDHLKDIVKKRGRVISMLDSTNRKNIRGHNMIDVLHRALQLWRQQRVDQMQDLLASTGNKNNPQFFAVCQAIIEAGAQKPGTHPETAEKRDIEAFLAGRHAEANSVSKINLDSYM